MKIESLSLLFSGLIIGFSGWLFQSGGGQESTTERSNQGLLAQLKELRGRVNELEYLKTVVRKDEDGDITIATGGSEKRIYVQFGTENAVPAMSWHVDEKNVIFQGSEFSLSNGMGRFRVLNDKDSEKKGAMLVIESHERKNFGNNSIELVASSNEVKLFFRHRYSEISHDYVTPLFLHFPFNSPDRKMQAHPQLRADGFMLTPTNQ